MKNLFIFLLASLMVIAMIVTGIDTLSHNSSMGLFITFVGSCTAIGLTIDIVSHFRSVRRKSNLR